MEDCERHVIAAAHHIVKALEASENLSDDMRRLLADLDLHLSTMTGLNEGEVENNREIENRLMSAQNTIMSLHSKIWDSSNPLITLEYLRAVEEIQSLTASLENMPLLNTSSRRKKNKQLLDHAHTILQIAMARLQHELIDILAQNKQCFEPEYVAIPACEETTVSNENEYDDSNASQRESSSTRTEEECVMDLIHPDVIPQIRSIANIMFASGYDHEFRQAFVGFWRDTIYEYLTILDIQHLSIEDVLQMEWKFLNSRIRKWRRAIKGIIGIYLSSAKRLFDQVLEDNSSTCFIEASKGPLLCLLNFGQAVSIGPHRPEWLYCLLDMYEVLTALIPDLDALFPEEIGSMVRIEFYDLVTRIGDSAKAIFLGLGNHIASCSSPTHPCANGVVHPLTKYFMNYILCFAEYGHTLNLLLVQSQDVSSVGTHLQLLTSILEANLDNKSNSYKDCSLKHIFMMNNIHYMVKKIRNNDKISTYFGDQWIRTHIGKFRWHATCYERYTWSCVLKLLRDDGKVGKATLKARCRAFTSAFEDVYKNQTRWYVPDSELREDLRISASKTVIHAYRNFISKINNNCISEKHIKYTEHDLETYILDLLEGSSKSLSHSRKR